MKSIAPAAVISVLVMCAIGALISLDGGVSADQAQPAGTACDTPSDPCWPGNLTETPTPEPGGMDAMSIDMDPSSEPANTATSIGSREFCARINENDVLDADEDDVDTLEIDVTTGPEGVPESHPLYGFELSVLYDPSIVRVVSNNVALMLDANPGSNVYNFSQPLPDTDGRYTVSAIDLSGDAGTSEMGAGVLTTLRLESWQSASSGVHHLILGGGVHVDPTAEGLFPAALNQAVLAMDVVCPGEQPEPDEPPGPTSGPTSLPTLPPPPPGSTLDALSIDMDPSADPANTATSIGSREFCGRINENELLDGDEDSVDLIAFDVTTGPVGFPTDNPMGSFHIALLYDPDAVMITSNSIEFLIPDNGFRFDASEPIPDSDGEFESVGLDTSFSGISGSGVLSRSSVATVDGAASGVHQLIVDPDASGYQNWQNSGFPALSHNHGIVAVDEACPTVQPPIPPPPVPDNDDFANADEIFPNSSVNGVKYVQRTTSATVETGEPLPCAGIGRTVWYTIDPSAEDRKIRVTSPIPNFDQVLAAYTGATLGDLSLIECAELDDPEGVMELEIPAGERLYIQVGGKDGASGLVRFQLEDITPTSTPAPPTVTPTPTPLPTAIIVDPTIVLDSTPTPSATPEAGESPTITPAGPPNAGGPPDATGDGDGLLLALAAVALGVATAGVWVGLRARAE